MTKLTRVFVALALVPFSCVLACAQDYHVEVLKEGPPADVLAPDIAGKIAPTGFRVVRGSNRTVCEIWPCKQWDVQPDFQASGEVLYPFQPGQLIGVLRFRRRGNDFRNQTVSRGVYTLRYGQQPIDGNHEGTFATRDFLLMLKAENDTSAGPMEVKAMMDASAEASDAGHPAILCLLPVRDPAGTSPSMRHNESQDWWIMRIHGKASANDQVRDLPIEIIVAGHAAE